MVVVALTFLFASMFNGEKSCSFLFIQAADIKETKRNDNIKKPNIMVIFADDLGTGDVPNYWDDSVVDMPNLKQFMSDGTTFTDAHATPLCATSRYVFLSGNYQHRGHRMAGVWSINYQTSQFLHRQQSIANVLRNNGYDTNMVGKWHIGEFDSNFNMR